jgi:hypothetical protein
VCGRKKKKFWHTPAILADTSPPILLLILIAFHVYITGKIVKLWQFQELMSYEEMNEEK